MRSIMVLNPKGGSGKSTIATNLAAYFAAEGQNVALSDLDPQGSSIAWLKVRPPGRPPIKQRAGRGTVRGAAGHGDGPAAHHARIVVSVRIAIGVHAAVQTVPDAI